MLNAFRTLCILIPFFAGLALCARSCRQCTGSQTISFDNYITGPQAEAFFKASIGNCATGADFEIQSTLSSVCQTSCAVKQVDPNRTICVTQGPQVCKVWTFDVKAWRYCGNGRSVKLNKGRHCIGSLCAASDNLDLNCVRSVHCRGDCDCNKCGC